MLDGLLRHHGAHVRPPGGVSDHGGSAADQGDGFIPRLLQPLHQTKRHKMSHMQAVRRRVEADIKGRLSVVDQIADLRLICQLGKKPSRL